MTKPSVRTPEKVRAFNRTHIALVKIPPAIITLACTIIGASFGYAVGNLMTWGVFGLFTGFMLDMALRRPHW